MSANHSCACKICDGHGPVLCHALKASWGRRLNMSLLTNASADTLLLAAVISTNELPREGDREKLQQMHQMLHNMLSGRSEDDDCNQGMFNGKDCTGCV